MVASLAAPARGQPDGRDNRADDDAKAGGTKDSKVELGLIPLVGGDTDVGVGVGVLSTLARVAPGYEPYVWAVELAGFASAKWDEGKVINPYQDYAVQVTMPHLAGGRLRLEIRPSYTKETTQRFYGLGNASPAPEDDVAARDFYGRTHPTLWVRARYRIWDHLHLGAGTSYTQNWLVIGPESTLGQQMVSDDPTLRRLLPVQRRHGVLLLEGLLLYDTRDSETVPERGQMHQARLRISPALAGDALPYGYQQLNLSARFYVPLMATRRLVFAARVVGDLQFDHPPFYELARYDDTFALGGLNGVRGVPGQRYYGKIKVFANFELRSKIVDFTLFGKELTLGAALFFDAGRAWADWGHHPELDGRGLGLKFGTGGGVRLQQGKTFVVRGDIAWSPDARPLGGYVGAGHTF